MVNRGRSKGCKTCRKRRVKCDEQQPFCNRCSHAGFECLGYGRDDGFVNIRFKDQTDVARGKRREPRGSTIERSPSDDGETLAMNFFIRNFAIRGRTSASSRGLFENIVPLLSKASTDSATALAASSVATYLFGKWRRDTGAHSTSLHSLGRAISRLRVDLQDSTRATDQATLMAILLLQFRENLSAVLDMHRAGRTHQDGALALVGRLPRSSLRTSVGRQLLAYLLNVEIAAAVREQRSLDPGIEAMHRSLTQSAPVNASARLDRIGLVVAGLQSRFTLLERDHGHCEPLPCTHSLDFTNVYRQAMYLEDELLSWKRSLPPNWHPRRWNKNAETTPMMPTLNRVCDIYPSIQIAALWNTWRSYRIIALRILAHIHAQISTDHPLAPDFSPCLQSLVEAICHSVPFHLGNRARPSTLEDLGDATLVFPAYYNWDPPESFRPRELPEEAMTREEHIHHAIAQGVWHILTPLTQILAWKAQWTKCCRACSGTLAEEHVDWVREQLMRTMMLLSLPRGATSSVPMVKADADVYSPKIRDALRLTSGS